MIRQFILFIILFFLFINVFFFYICCKEANKKKKTIANFLEHLESFRSESCNRKLFQLIVTNYYPILILIIEETTLDLYIYF